MPDGTCRVEGCEKAAKRRGWCHMHYERWRVHGDVMVTLLPRREGSRYASLDGFCALADCEQRATARGLCETHYTRWRRHGDPAICLLERFPGGLWERVNKGGPLPVHRPELGPCWLWSGPLDGKGYGKVKAGRVHRVLYEDLVGDIPAGLTLDHLCHNGSGCAGGTACPHRRCVNPAHLEPVTIGENVRRGNVCRP